MCLALIAVGQHPLFPIIILSNRDEFYKRPTVPAQFWPDYPNIFSGKDLVGDGTWLGVNKQGSFSLITNYRIANPYDVSLSSRGLLVRNFLIDSVQCSPHGYIKKTKTASNNYNPFSLIVGNMSNIVCYSNMDKKEHTLTKGTYGLSNRLLDASWHKVVEAKSLFNRLLNDLITYDEAEKISELLFPVLENRTIAPDDLLPETGVSKEIEKSLSPIFVHIPELEYGTRSSSIILFSKHHIFFSEKTFINAKMDSLTTTKIKIEM